MSTTQMHTHTSFATTSQTTSRTCTMLLRGHPKCINNIEEVTKTNICEQAIMMPTVSMPTVTMTATTVAGVLTNEVIKRRMRNARRKVDQNNEGNSMMTKTGNKTVVATAGNATTTKRMTMTTTKRTKKLKNMVLHQRKLNHPK